MSEIDELRRVAYGRTAGPADEAAAASARARLAELETPEPTPTTEVEPSRELEPESGVEPDGPITLTLVDPDDDPGYLHRLTASWRVWAVPAFAAFVIGIVLAVASGILLLRGLPVGDGTRPDDVVTSGEAVEAPKPGNLEVATAVLNSRQGPDDTAHPFDSSIEIEPATAHALRITADQLVYAAMSVDGEICMLVAETASGISTSTCLSPSQFVTQGIWLGMLASGHNLTVHWDGIVVTETWK